jgi:hypothetical protein
MNYIMNTLNSIKNLCSPALVYLSIESIILLSIILQNLNMQNRLCIGNYSCQMSSLVPFYIIKVLYISFWTFILNLMCKGGYSQFAWFLVILPILLFFVALGFFMISQLPMIN